MCHFRNKEIGIVFQNFNLIEKETVLDNILLAARITKTKNSTNINELISQVGLDTNVLLKKVRDLSGGEKQRVVRCVA